LAHQRIAVVGAGPSGAAAAHTLSKQGHEVSVFERSEHIGGRTYSHRVGEEYVDTGAGFITNFYPRTLALADELGFAKALQELHRVTGLYRDGEVAELAITSALSFLRFPFLGKRDKWRMSRWTAALSLRRSRYDIALPETLLELDHRSIGDMARQDLNEAIYHTLIRPGIEPFWYFDCEEVSAALAEALTAHAAGAKFYAFKGGIDQICSSLLGALTVHKGAGVTDIELSEDKVTLSWTDAQGAQSASFDKVVIATSARVARELVKSERAEWLTTQQKAFLKSQRYAANVHICYRVPRFDPPAECNAIFPCGRDRAPLAALAFHRRKCTLPEDHPSELVSVYLSDPESLRVMDWDDERLATHGLDLGRAMFPRLPTQAEIFHISRRKEAIPVHEVGRYKEALAFQETQARHQGQVFFCGDYLATATIDGAISTGLKAAECLSG